MRSSTPCDFAILAAQDEEVVSILQLAAEKEEFSIDGQLYYRVSMPIFADLPRSREIHGVVTTVGGMGRVNAAISTSQILAHLNPELILLVGVAGGFASNGISLGDLIVADRIVDYEDQKIRDDDIIYRLKHFEVDADLLDASRRAARDTHLPTSLEFSGKPPHVHFGPILSGDKVFSSERLVSRFLKIDGDVLGVEMEGAGSAAAVSRLRHGSKFLMIRGVVDLADSQKKRDADIWFDVVCDSVALLAAATIEQYYLATQ